jgi:hypothetical protein
LDELHVEKEKLSTYGITIDNKNYYSIIITSLPSFLSNFALSLLANMRLHTTMGTIDPDQLISLISEEYDRGMSQCLWCSTKSLKTDGKDKAMLVSSSWKGKKDCKPCGVCWNCGEKGHFKDNCPKPVKDTKKDSPNKSGSANAVVEDDLKDEAAFFVEGDRNLMMIFLSFALSPTLTLKV